MAGTADIQMCKSGEKPLWARVFATEKITINAEDAKDAEEKAPQFYGRLFATSALIILPRRRPLPPAGSPHAPAAGSSPAPAAENSQG